MIGNGLKSFRILFCTLVLSCGSAHAQFVTFSNVMDGNGSALYFDVASNVQVGNVLTLGLGAGVNVFAADGAATISAVDTMSMTITAPAGHFITSVAYSEAGTGETGTGGIAIATGSMVVDGMPSNFMSQLFNPNTAASAWVINPAAVLIANKSEITMSITNSLFAFLFDALNGPADIEKTSAVITVTTALIPVPPAVWLFGSAVVALGSIGARRKATI